MVNNSRDHLFINNLTFKDVTPKQVKSPILNVFLGDYALDIEELSKMFSFRFADNGDVQWLNIKLEEHDVESSCVCNECKYTFFLKDSQAIQNEIDSFFPSLINEICKKAKQRKYFEKSKLHINIILYAADSLCLHLDFLIKKLNESLKKAFINGIEASLFCIYEEHFDVNLEESKKNLDFIEMAYAVKSKYSNIVSGIYFLSNYNNDEIYTENCLKNLLKHISIYIEIKSICSISDINENFSENRFLYISDLLNAEHKLESTRNCCSIGSIVLQKPTEYIRKIIEYNVLMCYKEIAETKTRRALSRLNINSEMIPIQINDAFSSFKSISCKKNNSQLSFIDVKTQMDKISIKYDIDLTKQKIEKQTQKYYQDYQKSRINEIKALLYSVVNDENLTIFDFYALINNGIINSFEKETDKYRKKYNNAQCELAIWQQQKPLYSFQKNTLKRYVRNKFVSVSDKILYMKWKKLYIEREKHAAISELYKTFWEFFRNINQCTITTINSLNDNLIETEDELSDISTSLSHFQKENTLEYYSNLVKSVISTKNSIFFKNKLFENDLFDNNSLEVAAKKTVENIKLLSDEIYDEYVANSNCLEEYINRQGNTNPYQKFTKLLKEISKDNPISLRIIDNERINKQVFICLPYGTNIDKSIFSYIQENTNTENISVIECTDRKSIDIVYINGNIDMDDILHF